MSSKNNRSESSGTNPTLAIIVLIVVGLIISTCNKVFKNDNTRMTREEWEQSESDRTEESFDR